MAKSLPITATSSLFLALRNTKVYLASVCAAAANSVLEVFDGLIDSIATYAIANGGTGYVVGDIVTLVAGENGSADARASFRVLVVDHSSASSSPSNSASSSVSPSTSVSSSPSSSLSASSSVSSSVSHSVSPSTSVSSSPSHSVSPSTSVSSSPSHSVSPSSSVSPSTSVSSSPSSSVSPSTSVSHSPSSSVSSSISSSPSPSIAAGVITSVELISGGGGYTLSHTYAVTGGTGTGATFTASSLADLGASIAKVAAVPNTNSSPFEVDCGILTTKGISVRISGSGAEGHIVYE